MGKSNAKIVDLSIEKGYYNTMGYEVAINKAWADLANLMPSKQLSVKFLADEYSIDLENILKKQLKKTGVRKISTVSACTHNNNFFSYRRARTKKRMISVMMMEGEL